jgi:sterol desaturase/sphingolipid hydroxylase (fatty acid hydroxylase superfamily)
MDFEEMMLERGEILQYGLFFGFMVFFLVLETIIPRRRTPMNRRLRWPTNLGMTATNVVALGFVPFSFVGAALWAQSANIGLFNLIELPPWMLIPLTLLLRGLISTGTHMINHKVPWLWRIHRVHHLDTEIDVTSTVRFHPFEFLINPFIGVPVVLLFGLPAWILAAYELLDVVVTLFSHSDLRVGTKLNSLLRYVIVTPDLHRIHHSSWQPETDSNYGAVFPVWDLIFGTFRGHPRGRHEFMQLGLQELREPEANSYFGLLLSPIRRDLRESGADRIGERQTRNRSTV